MANLNLLAPILLKHEGGFQADKDDTGNWLNGKLIGTNMGITPGTYLEAYGKVPTIMDIKNLRKDQAIFILKTLYWDRWEADRIANQSIANFLVDWVYISGVWGIKIPQRVLGVEADGKVGNITIEKLNTLSSVELLERLKEARRTQVRNIAASKPAKKKFLQGWLNRINSFKYS